MPRLNIDIEAQLAKFQDSLTGIARHSERTTKQIDSAFSGLKSTLATFGVGLSLGGFAAFVKSGVDAADNLNKLSQKVGVSVESLSAFQYAAKLADVSSEQLSTGLAKLARNAADAQAGTGDAKDAFAALGISVLAAGGQLKGTEQLLLELSEKFSGIEDSAGKTALAMKIFGRAGAELIPFLNQGRSGIEELRNEAERFGIVISADTARAAEQFNDDMTRLASSVDKLKFALAEGALPALNKFVQELLNARAVAGGLGEALRLVALTDGRDPVEQLNKITATLEKLKATRAELVRGDNLANRLFPGFSDSDVQGINKQIKFLEQQRELLTRTAIAAGERDNFDRMGSGVPKKPAPGLPDRERDSKFQNAIKQLEQEALKVQELTRFEEVRAAIVAGHYGTLNEAQKSRFEQLAAEVDLRKEDARVQKEADAAATESDKRQQDALKAEDERITRIAEAALDNIDATRAWRREVDGLVEAYQKGLLTLEQLNQASLNPRLRSLLQPEQTDFDVLNQALKEGDISLEKYLETVKRLKDEAAQTNDVARDLGLTFASAFEDAALEVRSLEDALRVLQGLGKDVMRIFLRKSVTEPLAEGAGNLVKESGLAEGIGGFFKNLFRDTAVFEGHSGGVPGAGEGRRRPAPSWAFAGAPRFHSGIGPGEVPAIIRDDEAVLTPAQMRMLAPARGGGGAIHFTQVLQFSANTPEAVRAAVAAAAPALIQASVQGVADARSRGRRI